MRISAKEARAACNRVLSDVNILDYICSLIKESSDNGNSSIVIRKSGNVFDTTQAQSQMLNRLFENKECLSGITHTLTDNLGFQIDIHNYSYTGTYIEIKW